MKNTKILAVASIASALCVAIMAIGTLVEALDLSLAILAGLVVAVISLEFRERWGWSVFAVSGLLSLLLPGKTAGFVFLLFCGWYPMVQKRLQMLRPLWCWVLKEVIFNGVLAVYLVLSLKVLGIQEAAWITAATFVLANLLFILYDLLLDRFQIYYLVKLRDRIGLHKLK